MDLFLKWSRLIPRRALAKATCDAGHVQLNDHVVRAGHNVRVGDVITVITGSRQLKLRVSALPPRAPGKTGAGDMFELLETRRRGIDS